VQGVLDIPLSERGQCEVARMAHNLARSPGGSRISALYCGPGENVLRTAEIVGKAVGVRPRCIDEFRNLDQGLWQGLQIAEIRRRNTKLFRQWIDDPETICPPQGETVESAMGRIKAAFRPLLKRHHDEVIGLVVGDPLARMVAGYLKCEPRVHRDEHWSCDGIEWIEIAPLLLRNGAPS
jgi:broad specificity phosphatase PhoE